MRKVTVNLYYHLKEKAGTGQLQLEVPDRTTIKALKSILISKHPALQPHLGNIMVLIGRKIALDEDVIPADAQVSFLTPIGGG
jgi:molybdopterin converting factor small subunit